MPNERDRALWFSGIFAIYPDISMNQFYRIVKYLSDCNANESILNNLKKSKIHLQYEDLPVLETSFKVTYSREIYNGRMNRIA